MLARSRDRDVHPVVFWPVWLALQACCRTYFRLGIEGSRHVPSTGPVIIASNHRSFLDPFVITLLTRRPIHFVAKQELFRRPLVGRVLNVLGAFPVDRGRRDEDSMDTARAILARGGCVLIFPEGTRVRPGGLGRPKRGVGRLALETGAAVVPVAILGTESVRRGWRIRPHRVRMRCGPPLHFPQVAEPSARLAGAVMDRIWPCVQLQWEWLGGAPPLRRAAIVGAGAWGTSLAVALARAGLRVELGCRTEEQAAEIGRERRNEHYLPGVELPDAVRVMRAERMKLGDADIVCFAVPAGALPDAVAAHGSRVRERAGVLVVSKGLIAPLGTLPSAYVAERVTARAVACLGGPGHAADALAHGAALVVGTIDEAFGIQLQDTLRQAGLAAMTTTDVTGVELAGTAKNAAVLAAAVAGIAGPNAAGAAAGMVFAEVDAYARRRGGRPETFAGLAGAGDLVATVIAAGSRNRRAGELLGQGVPATRIGMEIGQASEALEGIRLLASTLERDGVSAPTIAGLAALVEGRIEPASFARSLTAPANGRSPAAV